MCGINPDKTPMINVPSPKIVPSHFSGSKLHQNKVKRITVETQHYNLTHTRFLSPHFLISTIYNSQHPISSTSGSSSAYPRDAPVLYPSSWPLSRQTFHIYPVQNALFSSPTHKPQASIPLNTYKVAASPHGHTIQLFCVGSGGQDRTLARRGRGRLK